VHRAGVAKEPGRPETKQREIREKSRMRGMYCRKEKDVCPQAPKSHDTSNH